MQKLIVFIFLFSGLCEVVAQKAIKKTFQMPPHARYAKGKVLVKAKPGFSSQATALSSGNQVGNVRFRSLAPLVKPEVQQYATAHRSARAQNPIVNIADYYALTFDPAVDVESYINDLYATGYFEIVEPEYTYKVDFTPNDPGLSKQYYLNLIKALNAWDITKGDSSVVIAIVDTGGNLLHADIKPNLYTNWLEYPPNGKDDDGNGYIDDYQGWDFIGSDTLNANNPNFIGDNDPSIANGGDISHGTWVAGCASAATNNGIGMAGVAFKSHLLFTKHSADNQRTTDGTEYNVYSGLLYAGYQKDVKIINCSFGGSGQSQIIQDIINHIVLDQNKLIVAAAGNDGSFTPSYPASYDNVISVAATDLNDKRASFSNYGTFVDLAAPGVGIYTTGYNNVYNTVDGTSFSSPITAGAAALVWAANPTFTAVQVGEQLRVSADATALYTANPGYKNQLGLGRLDVQRALTLSLPSIRASNPKLVNQNGLAPVPGDKALLSFTFTNSLRNTSAGIQISISTTSTAVKISKSSISPGIIAGGSAITNALTPFELTIAASAPQNSLVSVLITYSDGSYSDYQYVNFYVNPSFIDVNVNQVSTTMTSIGRIGYQDSQNATRTQGQGFIFNQNPLLFEMGLIMGTSATNIYNNVRGVSGGFDQDFSASVQIKQIVPGARSYSEIFGEFSNSTTPSQQAILVDYRSLVWKDSPYDKFVIVEYQLKNPTATALNNFYFGIFADWDITTNGANDAAAWDDGNKMGYVYPAQSAAKPYAGIQLLTGAAGYYAIDNDGAIAGNPFGLYNSKTGTQDFTKSQKFTTISATIGSGHERLQAGALTAGGADVSHVVSSGPLNIPAGQTVTLAFALHAAANLSDLQKSARYADSVYNFTLTAPKPVGDSVGTCYRSPATLTASGATQLKWYKTFTGGQSFLTGSHFTTGNLSNDTVFYVSNADHTYESVRTAMKATVVANPKIFTSGSTTLCSGDTVKLSVASADSIWWSSGQKVSTINATTAGKYSVKVKNTALACVSKSDTISVTVNPRPTANFSTSPELKVYTPISFSDQSAGATTWYWDFGDGTNATTQSPTHSYTVIKNYTVNLTVTAANGCTDSKSEILAVITAIDEPTASGVEVYPNPMSQQPLNVSIDGDDLSQAAIHLLNGLGQLVYEENISSGATHVDLAIPTGALPPGMYVIRVNVGGKIVTQKVIKGN